MKALAVDTGEKAEARTEAEPDLSTNQISAHSTLTLFNMSTFTKSSQSGVTGAVRGESGVMKTEESDSSEEEL